MSKKILKFDKFVNERYSDEEYMRMASDDISDDDILGEMSPEEFDAKMSELVGEEEEEYEDTVSEYEMDVLTPEDIEDAVSSVDAPSRETITKPTTAPPVTKPQRPNRRSPFRKDRPSTDPRPKADLEDLVDMDIDIMGNAPAKERETTIAPPITKPSTPTRRAPFRKDRPSTNPRPKARLKKATIDDLVKKAIELDNEE